MFEMIGKWVLTFFSGPLINGALDAYKAHLASVNSADAKAVELAVEDLKAQIEARKQAVILSGASRIGSIVQAGLALPVVVYINKVVIWDKVLAYWTAGSTDPIQGAVGIWVGLIISFYMGGQIASGVVGQVLNRFRK